MLTETWAALTRAATCASDISLGWNRGPAFRSTPPRSPPAFFLQIRERNDSGFMLPSKKTPQAPAPICLTKKISAIEISSPRSQILLPDLRSPSLAEQPPKKEMRICIVGSGAREVAIARSLKASPKCSAVSPLSFSLSASLSVGPHPGHAVAPNGEIISSPRSSLLIRPCFPNLQAVPRRARGHRPRAWTRQRLYTLLGDQISEHHPRQVLCFASTRNPALVVLPHPSSEPPPRLPSSPPARFTR